MTTIIFNQSFSSHWAGALWLCWRAFWRFQIEFLPQPHVHVHVPGHRLHWRSLSLCPEATWLGPYRTTTSPIDKFLTALCHLVYLRRLVGYSCLQRCQNCRTKFWPDDTKMMNQEAIQLAVLLETTWAKTVEYSSNVSFIFATTRLMWYFIFLTVEGRWHSYEW